MTPDHPEGFAQALEADPNDRGSLRALALLAEKTGDRDTAERYARRLIQADPTSHDAYMVLSRILNRPGSLSPLAVGYAQIGITKLRSDAYQNKMADAVLQGIKRYFSKNPPLARDRFVLNR